jgi:pimeloyl-ACP methyl ester carboxylesterase
MFKRTNAPSVHAPLTTTGTLISSLKNYVVCMPDYIGYGNSKDLHHPYLIKESLATSTIDLIKATKQLLTQREIESNNKLFLLGYSEGGYATLATAELLQNNYQEINITAVAPMAGSYDLKTTADIILSQDVYEEAHLPVFLVYSYDKYFKLNILDAVFNEPYNTDIRKYFDKNITDLNLSQNRNILFQDEFIQTYFSNQEMELKNKLKNNSLLDWNPNMPIRLYHCEADKVVPVENSLVAYDSFIENGSQNVELIIENGGSHSSCSLPFYIDALEWFDSF